MATSTQTIPAAGRIRRDDMTGLGPCMAAEDGLQRRLVAILAEVLSLDYVGIDDDYFALGGTSLQAAELFARIEAEQGKRLPLSTLYRAATVRQLAEVLRASGAGAVTPDAAEVEGPLVCIQKGGNRVPVFIVPGVGGEIVGLATLARSLGASRPVYGFVSRGLDGRREPHGNMSGVAAEYVEAMVAEVGTDRPVALLGICWGGTVAIEMARGLEARGMSIDLLAVLDPPYPMHDAPPVAERPVKGPGLGGFVVARAALYARTLRELGWRERARFVGERFRMLGEMLRQRDPFRGDRSEFLRRRVIAANQALLNSHEVALPASPLLLLQTKSRRSRRSIRDRQCWNRALQGQADIVEVPGRDTGDAISGELAGELASVLLARLS